MWPHRPKQLVVIATTTSRQSTRRAGLNRPPAGSRMYRYYPKLQLSKRHELAGGGGGFYACGDRGLAFDLGRCHLAADCGVALEIKGQENLVC